MWRRYELGEVGDHSHCRGGNYGVLKGFVLGLIVSGLEVPWMTGVSIPLNLSVHGALFIGWNAVSTDKQLRVEGDSEMGQTHPQMVRYVSGNESLGHLDERVYFCRDRWNGWRLFQADILAFPRRGRGYSQGAAVGFGDRIVSGNLGEYGVRSLNCCCLIVILLFIGRLRSCGRRIVGSWPKNLVQLRGCLN